MQIAVLRVIVPEPKVHLRSKAIESSRCVGVKQRKYHQGKEQAAVQIIWSIRLLRFGYLDNLTLSAR